MRFCILYNVVLILVWIFCVFFTPYFKWMSCSEVEEASPTEEVVESEETPEGVETGENGSLHYCREYLVTQ